MDFHAAMETFAEAWVAANTPTAVNVESHTRKQPCYQTDESQAIGVKGQGQVQQVGVAGHVGGVAMERAGTGTVGPTHGLSHSVDTSLKEPELSSLATGGSTKSLPIHCLVEQIPGTPSFESASSVTCAHSTVELDGYAILPSTTLLSDLVHTALVKLGYSSVDAITAKGAIQIKNWKPLTLDAITNNPQASIDDILSELTNVATLRIRIASQPKPSTADEVKEKLLQLLLSQSHSLLNQSGCPINQGLLSSISKGDNSVKIPEDLTSAFDKWYKEQLKQQLSKTVSNSVPRDKTPEPEAKHNELPKEPSPQTSPDSKEGVAGAPQPYFMASRTRVRTSFDPEHEIPRLHKWFQENQHPSREQMIHFMNELNRLDSRKGRRPLDLTNIIYWFKNARAAQRRASKAVDDSFEGEENTDLPPGSLLSGHYPYLPNKNAVYVIPFPYHQQLGEQDVGLDQPCDLSMNKKKDITSDRPAQRLKESVDANSEDVKPVNMTNGYETDRQRETTPPMEVEIKREEFVEKLNIDEVEGDSVSHVEVCENGTSDCCKSVHDKSGCTDNSIYREDHQKDVQDDKRLYYDDSSEDISESESDEDDRSSVLVQKEDLDHVMSSRCDISSASMSAAASMAAMSLAQMAQPLHIPQLNPPLMTYYPMNTRFYSPHANSVHEAVHTNSHKHHEPRKRRTRVFIDPLTEIPKLEKWFLEDTHPSAYMIDKFCDELNSVKSPGWPAVWDDQAVRCAVLNLLTEVNQQTLAKSSPLCQSMISNIANGKYVNKLSGDKCREFGEWYRRYKAQALNFPPTSYKGIPKDTRLTFHAQYEVPLLKSWYASCPQPTPDRLRFYCSELNRGHVRTARPPVTPPRLKQWWKNEKQKERRRQREGAPPTPSHAQINPDSSSETSIIDVISDDILPDRAELDSSTPSVDIHRPDQGNVCNVNIHRCEQAIVHDMSTSRGERSNVHNMNTQRSEQSSDVQIMSTTFVDAHSWI